MSFKSILHEDFTARPVYRRLKGKPPSWDGLFNFSNIAQNLLNIGTVSLGGCSIRRSGGQFECYPISFEMPSSAAMSIFPDLKVEILTELASFQPVRFDDIRTLVFYTHIGLIADFLVMEDDVFLASVAGDKRFASRRHIRRPTLFEPLASAVLLLREGGEVQANRRISASLAAATLRLGVATLELPGDYELEKTVVTLDSYHETLNRITFPDSERSFHLKFRKLGSFRVDGFYSEELNTVVVDPRMADVFYHELGHLIYDRKISISVIIGANDSEEFARLFYRAIKGVDWSA